MRVLLKHFAMLNVLLDVHTVTQQNKTRILPVAIDDVISCDHTYASTRHMLAWHIYN
jgi:hypothetical protein